MFRRFRSLLRVLASRRDFETGMTDELRLHVDQYAEDLMRSGVPQQEAERRARMEFGDLNSVKEHCREARALQPFDALARNLRYAARVLRRTPGFTVTALLTLALCLGANLTIFAVIDAILIRALPFPHANRLVTIFNTYPRAGVDRDGSSIANYYERRGRIPAFSSVSIYSFDTAIAGERTSRQREQITRVSPDFFTTLGVEPAFGRGFTDAETTYQTSNVVILGNEYWREHFDSDPHIIGRKVWMDSTPDTVVGVLPPGFRFLSWKAELYVPLASSLEQRSSAERHSGGNRIQMIARLKAGATLAQAQTQIDAQNAALEKYDDEAKMIAEAGFRSPVVPLHADQVAQIRPTLLLLQAGVLVLLLIGTVNLTNLVFIRANARMKESAVRQALGASRRAVISEALVETTLLALAGGLLGLAAGYGGTRLVAAIGADRLPFGSEIALDGRVALVGLAGALLLGILLAVPMSWFNLRRQQIWHLHTESRGATSSRGAQMVRHSFVVAQIALAFVLLAGAGLLGLSLDRAMAVFPGFEADHVIAGQISLVGNNYPSAAAGVTFIERLVGKVEANPGVMAAGTASNIPFSGNDGKSAISVEGHIFKPGESARGYYVYAVGGDYFRAMGFKLRAGRFLTGADSRRKERTCTVDESFARYYWPHGSAIGQRLFLGSNPGPDNEAFRVVGVVGSTKQAGLTEDTAQGAVYFPYAYLPNKDMFVVIRGSGGMESLRLTLQRAVRQVDPDVAVSAVQSMGDRITQSLITRRSPALLAGIFSAIALLLVAIGTYGVLSYMLAQRSREIAVRIALGARPGQIGAQFLYVVLRLLIAGAALGIMGALLAGGTMRAVLFHVPGDSPMILAGSTLLIALVCLAACMLPVWRATRIAPAQALAEQ